MMDLFTPNGHLTHEALHALGGESLNELERLEVSEHLSFCDDCLTAYLAVLDGTTLLEPAEPLEGKVLKAAKRKGRAVMLARYTSVAAAAALAVTLWGTGLLGSLGGVITDLGGGAAAPGGPGSETSAVGTIADTEAGTPRAPLGTRFDNALATVNNHMNSFLGGGISAPTREDSEELDERAKREALFGTGAEKDAETDNTQ